MGGIFKCQIIFALKRLHFTPGSFRKCARVRILLVKIKVVEDLSTFLIATAIIV